MATDMQRLIVSLEARTAAFEKAMNRANGVANRRAKSIESTFAKANARIGASFAGVGKRWIAALAAGASVGALKNLSDAATRIDNALKVAGVSGEDLEKVYLRLRDSAVKNAAPIEDLVTLYSRASMAAANLGASQEDLLKFSDNVAMALRVSGKSAQEASGALLQLSQVLGGSVVQAQEYNSLIDGAYPLLQAVAAGLKEAGGDVAKLTALVKSGEMPTKAFFDAFQAGSVVLEQKVADSTFTISQAMGNLQTSLIDAAREFNNSTGASEKFATGINNIAKAVTDFDVSGFIKKIQEAGGALEKFLDDVGNSPFFERIAEAITGLELEAGKPISLDTLEAEKDIANLERQIKILEQRIEANKKMAIDTTEAEANLDALVQKANLARAAISGTRPTFQPGTPGDPNALAEMSARAVHDAAPRTPINAVSVKDYEIPGKDKDKKGRKSEYAREIEQIRERTAALQAETAAMAGLNPLINDYGFAVEKARAVAELENAALAAKVELTPQVRASIDSLATSYANAVVEAEALAEKQDRVRESAKEMAELGKDVFGGFISDMRNGKSAAEALQGALNRVLDELIKISLNSIFDSGGGLGGILGSIGKIFGGYADGGYTGAGGKHQPAGVVHKGEVVFSQNDVRRNGGVAAVESMRRGAPGFALGGPVGAPSVSSPAASQPQQITIHLVGEEGEMFTPRVRQISGETAGVVVRESRPQLSRDAVSSVQSASRNRPGLFRS